MANFIHRWLNPHCTHCTLDKKCSSCDTLRELLEQERAVNKQLLAALIEPQRDIIVAQPTEPQPIKKHIPWRVRQEMLETEDRKKAQILKDKSLELVEANKSTEQLEKELLGDDDAISERHA